MKIGLLFIATSLLLGGCISVRPTAPVTRTIYVPADVQTVYVVRETPVYYPPARWSFGIGFGGGHYRGPWRR